MFVCRISVSCKSLTNMTLISLTALMIQPLRIQEILAAVYMNPSDLVLQGMKTSQVSYVPQLRRNNFCYQCNCFSNKHLSTFLGGFQSESVAFQIFFLQIPATVINLNAHQKRNLSKSSNSQMQFVFTPLWPISV